MEITEKYVKDFFKDLKFDEPSHTYTVNGCKIRKSVSGLLKDYYEQFDSAKIAPFSARKAGISTEEMLAQWAAKGLEATDRGTKVHYFGEMFAKDRTLTPDGIQEEAIAEWFTKMPSHLVPFLEEIRMYDKVKMFAGTADGVLYNKLTGKYIIYDFKTNKDLDKCYRNKKMLGSFKDLLDTSFNKYQLQLSYYKNMLEQIPEIEVEAMIILWLPHDGGYQMRYCNDFSERLKQLN